MELLARHYEDILLEYRFIRALGVQLNLKSELVIFHQVVINNDDKTTTIIYFEFCALFIVILN